MSSRLIHRGREGVPKHTPGHRISSEPREVLGALEQETAKAVEEERSEGVSQERAFPGGADERTKRTSPSPSAVTPPTNSLAPLEYLPGVPTVS